MKKKAADPDLLRRMTGMDRRRLLILGSALGAAAALPGTSRGEDRRELSKEVLASAEEIAGLSFGDGDRELMLKGVDEAREDYAEIRALELSNQVAPALRFDPNPARSGAGGLGRVTAGPPGLASRPSAEALAAAPLADLGHFLRDRQITSAELTGLYLERLRRYDPLLECVISLTEDRALEAAERADRELAAGRDRGPLHGIPWGAKDLLAVSGYRTTWGAEPFKEQVLDHDATVVRRLDEAGAVLVAKLTLGALAWGDVWYGGKTRNPWSPEQGSSGSSAGSASATAAALVGFAIGSETWGSIVSPSTRCGATGLRPTFGRVSRHGAMALSWSMDKLGPLCRSVEDCALVLGAIHGRDGLDPTAEDRPFSWPAKGDPRKLRVGFVKALFEVEPEEGEQIDTESRDHDLATLESLRAQGFELIPLELPDYPVEALSFVLSAEAAAAFDQLTRSGRDDLMVRQIEQAWPNVFRQARLIPAVEYIQANRARGLVIEAMRRTMADLDVYVVPSFGGNNLLMNNLTGHPCVVLPNGFREDGTPTSITFVGDLFGEMKMLAVAKAYQDATGFHHRRPDLEAGWKIKEEAAKKAKEEGA